MKCSGDSEIKFLASYGASSCVIVVVRNRKTHQTLITHIDSLTSRTGLQNVLETMQSPQDCDVYITGGEEKTFLSNILTILRTCGYDIKYALIGKSTNLKFGRSMIISLENGNIYTGDDARVYIAEVPRWRKDFLHNLVLSGETTKLHERLP